MMVSPDTAYIRKRKKNRQETENGKTVQKLEKTGDFL
jgi:hypothetical protein